jgi:hypothetical protein
LAGVSGKSQYFDHYVRSGFRLFDPETPRRRWASVFQQTARLKSNRLTDPEARLDRYSLTLAISRARLANGAGKTKSGNPPSPYPFKAATVSVAFSSMKPISLLQLRKRMP